MRLEKKKNIRCLYPVDRKVRAYAEGEMPLSPG